MTRLTALIAGLLFGSGLLLSGMTNPANVLAFLNVEGPWQPSLAFTMAAAIAVAAPAYWLAHQRTRSFLGTQFSWPARRPIEWRLLAGSVIFGLGWGLSGICPGPALLLLTRPQLRSVVFFASLVLGLLAARAFGPRVPQKSVHAPDTSQVSTACR